MGVANIKGVRIRAGWVALALFLVNAAVLVWVIVAAGDGVGAGLGVAALFLGLTLPVVLISLVVGIVGIRRRSATVPAIITVALVGVTLAVCLYGFLSTQVF